MPRLDLNVVVWGSALALVLLAACTDRDGGGGAGANASGGGGSGGETPSIQRVRVFHTSDEHGWIIPDEVALPGLVLGGAAATFGHMRGEDAFDAGADLLVSSGDNWTGPAISTYFQGEPVVEVFDAMGYRATAVGNHELDFDLDVLAERAAEASYPHLAANLFVSGTELHPEGVSPVLRVVVGEVDVALVGLAGSHMGETATPWSMATLEARDPQATLEAQANAARADGADVVIALYHDCNSAELLEGIGAEVDLVLGGHCHAARNGEVEGVPFVESASNFAGYSRIDLELDRVTGEVRVAEVVFREVSWPAGGQPKHPADPEITALVAGWSAQAETALGELVGHSVTGLENRSWPLANWITDAWLAAYPEADAAVLNFGSLRQALPSGDFTVGDLVGIAPFENRLVVAELTGAELSAFVAERVANCPRQGNCYPAVAGMRFDRTSIPLAIEIAGAPLEATASYSVLLTDYLYYGGEGAPLLEADPNAVLTDVLYREPAIAWTKALGLSPSDPLEAHVDFTERDTPSN